MSGQQQYNYNMWEDDGWNSNDQFYSPNEMLVNTDDLKFQPTEYNEYGTPKQQIYNSNYSAKMAFFYEPPNDQADGYMDTSKTPQIENIYKERDSQFIERPLLEELEIFPDQIMHNIKVVLDPFKHNVVSDCDMGGPLIFYLCLATAMFLAGGKINFGYVYGISVIGCILMYMLLKLMTDSNDISLMGVASALGYCNLPVVIFSVIGIFFRLKNYFGYSLAIISIIWASFAASKIFCALSKDFTQRPLIMYPCALLYGVFTLLVIF